jgi:hypothetical protein
MPWPNLRCYPGICLERLRNSTKNLSEDSVPPGRDSNQGPPQYEAGILTARRGPTHFASSKYFFGALLHINSWFQWNKGLK